MSDTERYEMLPHRADCKIRVYGHMLSELFSNALYGTFELCKPRKKKPEKTVQHSLDCTASTTERRLVDFFSHCTALSDIHNKSYSQVTFTLFTPQHCSARIYSAQIMCFEEIEIKAVTYHDHEIDRDHTGWKAMIVFDI